MRPIFIISIIVIPIVLFAILVIRGEQYVVLDPIFTQSAYQPSGFYDYYDHKCSEECLTTPITTNNDYSKTRYADNFNFEILSRMMGLTYHITDIDLINNPSLIDGRTLIILHNEYVTQEEYNIIMNHDNVVYFYPNSLYAKISYHNNKITLLSGHGYNNTDIAFLFGHSSKYEYQNNCDGIHFIHLAYRNGYDLRCYPNNGFDIARLISELP